MRFYSVLNLKRQQFGPAVISETGLKALQSEPKFDENYKVIGETDQSGNLLQNISQNNFISKPPEVKKPEPIKKEIINESGPEFQDFTEEEKQIIENGRKQSERANEEARQATQEPGGGSDKPLDPAQPGTGKRRGRPKRTDTAKGD